MLELNCLQKFKDTLLHKHFLSHDVGNFVICHHCDQNTLSYHKEAYSIDCKFRILFDDICLQCAISRDLLKYYIFFKSHFRICGFILCGSSKCLGELYQFSKQLYRKCLLHDYLLLFKSYMNISRKKSNLCILVFSIHDCNGHMFSCIPAAICVTNVFDHYPELIEVHNLCTIHEVGFR